MLKRLGTSFVVLWIVIGSLFAAGLEISYVTNCHATQHSWDAIDRIVQAATNPPSRAGQALTPQQQTALAGYRKTLEDANGARPSCAPF